MSQHISAPAGSAGLDPVALQILKAAKESAEQSAQAAAEAARAAQQVESATASQAGVLTKMADAGVAVSDSVTKLANAVDRAIAMLDDPTFLGLDPNQWIAIGSVGAFMVLITQLIAQQRRVASETRQNTLQGRASFIVDVGERLNSSEARQSFRLLSDIRDQVAKRVAEAHPERSEEEREVMIREEYTEEIERLSHEEPDKYQAIIGTLNFLESVGLTARNGYVPVEDLRSLFELQLVRLGHLTFDLIAQMRTRSGHARLYEHLEWLLARSTHDS